jgi:hypothetical protein
MYFHNFIMAALIPQPQINNPGVAPPLNLPEPMMNKIRLCLEAYYYPDRVPPAGQRHLFLMHIGLSWNDGRWKHWVQQVVNIWDYCQSIHLPVKRQAYLFANQQLSSHAVDMSGYRELIKAADLGYHNNIDEELTNYFQFGEGQLNRFIDNVHAAMIPGAIAGQG